MLIVGIDINIVCYEDSRNAQEKDLKCVVFIFFLYLKNATHLSLSVQPFGWQEPSGLNLNCPRSTKVA